MDRRNVKNVRIIKRLLESPDGEWTKYGLAKASGCSRPWVIEFLGTLERASLVSGTKVTDIMGLVKYGARIIPPPLRSVACHHQQPLKLLRTAGTEYAITTTYAENEVTHHLFKTRCDAYVTEGAMKRLWKRVVRDGLLGRGNLRLIIPVDGDIIKEARTIRGIRVVSMGQLMMDLMKEGGVDVQAVEEMVKRHVR
jgi:hypothetical protein